MPTNLARITFTITEEMKAPLGRFKKEIFYDRNNSEMIRELVMAGMRALDEKTAQESKREQSA
jgi:hypothetical protein